MENKSYCKVCVTGGSGYIGSSLVQKLLERGYTVHATLRNLDDTSKVGLLKSLPNADTRLKLFQADIYKPNEFEAAIEGCNYVFHVATPMKHNPQSSQYKDTVEAAIAGVKSIADCCIRSESVKRLIYTASVTASSPLKEDWTGYKSSYDESCWTPINLPSTYDDHFLLGYAKSKTLAEKEVLRYNVNDEIENGKLEVVSLVCGLVGGDTILPYASGSIETTIAHLKGDPIIYSGLRFIQLLLGSIPLLHIDDACEAHIFCMEKPSLTGRFLCAATDASTKEIANYYRENYPQFKISQKEFREDSDRGSRCDATKLMKEGFEYKCDMKKILDDSVECVRRFGGLSLN